MTGSAELTWLAGRVGDRARVLEVGVGAGELALPLVDHLLKQGRPVDYHGVDVSGATLERLAADDAAGHIRATRVDAIDTGYGTGFDTVLCLRSTLSPTGRSDVNLRVFVNAANALVPGGNLIVETRTADSADSHDGLDTSIAYVMPDPDGTKALVCFSTRRGEERSVDQHWIAQGAARTVRESTRASVVDEFDTYATIAGLDPVARTSGLSGAPVDPNDATVTAEYRKPF